MPILEKEVSSAEKQESSWSSFLWIFTQKKRKVATQLTLPFRDAFGVSPAALNENGIQEEEPGRRGLTRRAYPRSGAGRRRHNWSTQLYLVWDLVFHPMMYISQGKLDHYPDD